jgi:hypothetical protein
MKNIYWYDPDSNLIKTASHVRFDEGMSDLPDPPPNVQLLQRIEHDDIVPDANEIAIDPVEFIIDNSPFRSIDNITINILCDLPTFGFNIDQCHIRHRAYLSTVEPNSSASNIRNIRRKYTGAYIVQIQETPIFDTQDALQAFALIREDPTILSFIIHLAPERYVALRDRREPLRINAIQLHHITQICSHVPPQSFHVHRIDIRPIT